MASPICAFNSAAALRRVFIPSTLEFSNCLHVTRIFVPALLPPSQQQHTRNSSHGLGSFLRNNSTAGTWGATTSPYKKAPVARPTPTPIVTPRRHPINPDAPGPRVKTKLARLPRDDEIRAKNVYVLEKQADGVERLSELQYLPDVLAKLDRKTESLQVLVEPNPDNPEAPRYPIAKIVNKKAELALKQKQKEEQKKQAAANKEKELELNWAMAPHDIEHKLRTLQKFLAKGWKVQVLLLKKSGKGMKASKKQADELLAKMTEAVTEVTGSREWKGREGQVLGSMRVFLQGKLQETQDTAKANKGKFAKASNGSNGKAAGETAEARATEETP